MTSFNVNTFPIFMKDFEGNPGKCKLSMYWAHKYDDGKVDIEKAGWFETQKIYREYMRNKGLTAYVEVVEDDAFIHSGKRVCFGSYKIKSLQEGAEEAFKMIDEIYTSGVMVNWASYRRNIHGYSDTYGPQRDVVYGNGKRVCHVEGEYFENPLDVHIEVMEKDRNIWEITLYSHLLGKDIYTEAYTSRPEPSDFYNKCMAMHALAQMPEGSAPIYVKDDSLSVYAMSIEDGEPQIRKITDIREGAANALCKLMHPLVISISDVGNNKEFTFSSGGSAVGKSIADIKDKVFDAVIDCYQEPSSELIEKLKTFKQVIKQKNLEKGETETFTEK